MHARPKLYACGDSAVWTSFECADPNTISRANSRRLSGVPEMCVAERRGGAPFGSVSAALSFAVYNEAVLGVGPLSLVIAEDRDEDRLARARASRAGVEFVSTRRMRAASTGSVKSQRLVELRCDVLRAISASKVGVVDLALLVQSDVGVWRPAGAEAVARAVLDYVRWRLGAELARRSVGDAERGEGGLSAGTITATAASVRGLLDRLPAKLTRVPGALMREIARRWRTSRPEIERDAIEWRAANPAGPVELVRLKPGEIAKRLAALAPDDDDVKTITAQAIGRRIAVSRRAVMRELVRCGLAPPPSLRRAARPEPAPIEPYIPIQARLQR